MPQPHLKLSRRDLQTVRDALCDQLWEPFCANRKTLIRIVNQLNRLVDYPKRKRSL